MQLSLFASMDRPLSLLTLLYLVLAISSLTFPLSSPALLARPLLVFCPLVTLIQTALHIPSLRTHFECPTDPADTFCLPRWVGLVRPPVLSPDQMMTRPYPQHTPPCTPTLLSTGSRTSRIVSLYPPT